jgi:hypothetical protein
MNAGSVELKIVKPSGEPAPQPATPTPAQQAAKPVSRLEQLRQQAKGGTP